MKKFFWWICNRGRIQLALQKSVDSGRISCAVFWLADWDKRLLIMKDIRRHRRNLDRLKQLYAGRSPWDTAKMEGWQRRDAAFRLMEIGAGG